jgi:spermidine synthase
VGVVGLGVGTLATYARPGDVFRFYEINPAVVRLARKHFTYLRDCQATEKPVLLGDARLVMQRESPQKYDVLLLDAFSSDAIPVHLLTKEAFDLYLKHLNPTGSSVIAVHISNRHLDLHPVLAEAARAMGWKLRVYIQPKQFPTFGESSSTWALMGPDESRLTGDHFDGLAQPPAPAPARRVKLWTDEYASLLPILK